jgi:methylphosphotriester-DNA--protein-cysteine methyltransferase
MDGNIYDDDTKWGAVRNRDVAMDGLFVYAVRTTKIYCRPVCKARLARRSNVTFHETPKEAERAGYRPCKRCKPDKAGAMPEEDAVRRIRAMINHTEPSSTGVRHRDLSQLAKEAGLSKWHFHRVFKQVAGETPIEFLRAKKSTSNTLLSVPPAGQPINAKTNGPASLGGPSIDLDDFPVDADDTSYLDLCLWTDE